MENTRQAGRKGAKRWQEGNNEKTRSAGTHLSHDPAGPPAPPALRRLRQREERREKGLERRPGAGPQRDRGRKAPPPPRPGPAALPSCSPRRELRSGAAGREHTGEVQLGTVARYCWEYQGEVLPGTAARYGWEQWEEAPLVAARACTVAGARR